MSDINAENTPLEFPCQLGVKAMGHAGANLPLRVEAIVAERAAVLDVHTTGSRHGRYVSVTVTVEAQSREQLEDVYRALGEDDAVIFTL